MSTGGAWSMRSLPNRSRRPCAGRVARHTGPVNQHRVPAYRVPDNIAWVDGADFGLAEELYLTVVPDGRTVMLKDSARLIWLVAADGARIFLGRETRLANRAQRRALRALHRTCALCDTAFEPCQIHHVHWFEHGGRTDIDGLLPLCNRHHHLVHEGGWHLHLAPDRTLTVTRPGGQVTVHGPPRARAA